MVRIKNNLFLLSLMNFLAKFSPTKVPNVILSAANAPTLATTKAFPPIEGTFLDTSIPTLYAPYPAIGLGKLTINYYN